MRPQGLGSDRRGSLGRHERGAGRRGDAQLLSRDYYVERTITREEYSAARAPLVERIGQADALLARLDQQGPAPDLPGTGEELRSWWEEAQTPRVIGLVIDHITVKPVERRGYNRFNPARLEPHWRA